MCVNNLPKVAIQWNSGATRDSNRGRRVLIPSALTTTPLSHTCIVYYLLSLFTARRNDDSIVFSIVAEFFFSRCFHDNSRTAVLSLMKLCTNMHPDNL